MTEPKPPSRRPGSLPPATDPQTLKLENIYARQEAANLLMIGLSHMWRAWCYKCKREEYAPGSGAMIAAHEFLEKGWMAETHGIGARLICPDCGIL